MAGDACATAVGVLLPALWSRRFQQDVERELQEAQQRPLQRQDVRTHQRPQRVDKYPRGWKTVVRATAPVPTVPSSCPAGDSDHDSGRDCGRDSSACSPSDASDDRAPPGDALPAAVTAVTAVVRDTAAVRGAVVRDTAAVRGAGAAGSRGDNAGVATHSSDVIERVATPAPELSAKRQWCVPAIAVWCLDDRAAGLCDG